MSDREYLSAKSLAVILDVSEKTVYRQLKAGKIPAFKIGGQWRIDLQAFLAKTSQSPDAESSDVSGDTKPPDQDQVALQAADDIVRKSVIPGPKPKWLKGRTGY